MRTENLIPRIYSTFARGQTAQDITYAPRLTEPVIQETLRFRFPLHKTEEYVIWRRKEIQNQKAHT